MAYVTYPPEPCPECAAGKCQNCDALTWDNEADLYADCPCFIRDHAPADGDVAVSPERKTTS